MIYLLQLFKKLNVVKFSQESIIDVNLDIVILALEIYIFHIRTLSSDDENLNLFVYDSYCCICILYSDIGIFKYISKSRYFFSQSTFFFK